MRSEEFSADRLKSLLNRQKIATLTELKIALGTDVDKTVFRKLATLSYRSSYSHCGKFYSLDKIVSFNKQGLWSFKSIWFSRFGTLINTIEQFVKNSTTGYSSEELKLKLHVSVKKQLLKLYRRDLLHREKIESIYFYFSVDSMKQRQQVTFRRDQELESDLESDSLDSVPLLNEMRAAIVLFYCLLNERDRRVYAGLESLRSGHGGDKKVADLLGLDVHTVAKGRMEILNRDILEERIRKTGGGRKRMEKKHQKS